MAWVLFVLFYLTGHFLYTLSSDFVFLCVCVSASVSCAFSCSFVLFVLSYSNLSVFYLFYFILLLFLRCVWFLRRDRKGVEPDWREGAEKLREVGGGEIIIRIYGIKIFLLNKRKIFYKKNGSVCC